VSDVTTELAMESNDKAMEIARLKAENAKLRELARWAARILTGIFPYVDYSRCTALEAVAAWKVEASKLGIEVDE
jgi:hypothetical protein